MTPWRFYHVVVLLVMVAAAGAGGYVVGATLTPAAGNESLKNQIIQNIVEQKLGKKPGQVISLSGTDFADFAGNVLESGPQKQYFIVKMDKKPELKSSALETVPEEQLNIKDTYTVIVDEDGNTETLKVRY